MLSNHVKKEVIFGDKLIRRHFIFHYLIYISSWLNVSLLIKKQWDFIYFLYWKVQSIYICWKMVHQDTVAILWMVIITMGFKIVYNLRLPKSTGIHSVINGLEKCGLGTCFQFPKVMYHLWFPIQFASLRTLTIVNEGVRDRFICS
jgi:hypothetical protein